MVKNRDKWTAIATQIAGVAPDVANFAVQRGCMGFPIEVSAIRKFGSIAPDYGVTKADVSKSILQYVDLSYLKEVTHLSEKRLISTPACAPDGQRSPTGILGTDDGDKLNGSAGADKIFGLAGDDTVNGLGGNDILDGGTGNDRLDGGGGNDSIAGGDGNDVMMGGVGNDQLRGGEGNDRLVGGAGNNAYNSGSGNDSVDSRNGKRETILCGAGRDTVRSDAADRLVGCEIRR
jgi:Ca2+-binding RTX toxin-like protein